MAVYGNSLIFCLFIVSNITLFIMGAAILGIGGYLWVLTKDPNTFNICFLGTGSFIMVLSILSFCLRKSKYRIKLYNWLLTMIFVIQLILTIMFLAFRSKLIKWAVDNSGSSGPEVEKRMSSNVTIAQVIVVVACLVTLCCSIFGHCYRRSTESR